MVHLHRGARYGALIPADVYDTNKKARASLQHDDKWRELGKVFYLLYALTYM